MSAVQQTLLAETASGVGSDPWVGTTVTWNPSDKGALWTLSNANLSASHSASGTMELVRANTDRSSGKWYFEYFIEPTNNGNLGSSRGRPGVGLCKIGSSTTGVQIGITDSNGIANCYDGFIQANTTSITGGATMATSDVIGVAVDFTAGKIWFAKNNTFVGSPSAGTGNAVITGISGSYFPAISSAFGGFVTARFKTADFTYTPPTGFTSWQT